MSNKVSMCVCEKVGLEFKGTMRQHMLRNGEFSDTQMIGVLRKKWMENFGDK